MTELTDGVIEILRRMSATVNRLNLWIIFSAIKSNSKHGKKARTDVRLVAKKALLQLLEPLVGVRSNSGLSTLELHSIFREAGGSKFR